MKSRMLDSDRLDINRNCGNSFLHFPNAMLENMTKRVGQSRRPTRCERYLRIGRASRIRSATAFGLLTPRETAEGYLETRVQGSYRARTAAAFSALRRTDLCARRPTAREDP